MSTIYRMPKGQWRAQVRRKGRYVSQSFVRRKDAEEWALKMERVALKRLGLDGKAQERDRRPTQEELDRLVAFFEGNSRQLIRSCSFSASFQRSKSDHEVQPELERNLATTASRASSPNGKRSATELAKNYIMFIEDRWPRTSPDISQG